MTGFISIRNISKSFSNRQGADHNPVLSNIGLDIEKGEFVTLFGPNGCGKTTLLNILAGFLSSDSGTILINGKEPGRAQVGFVFQDYRESLLPWRTVRDNIGMYYFMAGERKQRVHARVSELAAALSLELPLDTYPYLLSGGQQQLVAIARSLIYQPDLLIMDEPLSALDLQSRMETQQAILSIWRATGVSTLFVSHDIDEAIYLADRVVMLTRRPASVHKVLSVDLPRPRSPHMIEESSFGRLRSSAVAAFREILD